MINVWKIFLSSILISSFTIGTTQTIANLTINNNAELPSRPFYQNIDEKFNNFNADVAKQVAKPNQSHVGGIGQIFKWKTYADSWEEFKANYGSLTLKVNMEIAFNWYNIKWKGTSIYVPLNNIKNNINNWIQIAHLQIKTTQTWRNDNTHGILYYNCWYSDTNVFVKFKLVNEASNNYDNYYYKIDTQHVTCNTTFNFNSIKEKFEEHVNNKSLELESAFSSSLLDENNKKTSQIAIDNLIQTGLGPYYYLWKPYISPYIYDDLTNQATVIVKVTNPNNNQKYLWEFKVGIKYTLSQEFWDKNFQERLTITPGKIINPNNPNSELITDQPLRWENKDVYGTTAIIRFDGKPDGSETMKVNGVPIQVIDNTFTFDMTDNQAHETNQYEILLERHNLNDWSDIIATYKINYWIKQDIPNLDLKWYAWNPTLNPDQNKLIEPTLPNGDVNPDYDPEVNVNTGTKTQIVWIKHQAEKPFPLDPLDKNGDEITNGQFDTGFLAEGSVSGMGINQSFSDPWIKSVARVQVNPKTLKPIGNLEVIKSDSEGQHFSKSGIYLYIITDQKGITANKLIIIGQQWQNKYAKFLEVLNQPSIAVPFWNTIQGFHLKNYLGKYKNLNSKNIQDLSFEQVSSYWKEYVSDVKTQKVGPDIDPGNIINLNDLRFEDIKMNKAKLEDIKEEIINGVDGIAKQLKSKQLEYNLDYQIDNLDQKVKELLNGYQENGQAIVELTVTALDTSMKAKGISQPIKVRNSKNYDPKQVIDLSTIKFESHSYNFKKFNVDQLRENYILKPIKKRLQQEAIQLVYQTDYGVEPLDDDTLQAFINAKELTKLEIIIKAELMSDNAKNSTTLILINDPDGEIAPPEPPDPKPDPEPTPLPPDDNNSWISSKESLIIMSIISLLIVGTTGTIIFFKYRFKKGIGGKKNKIK